MTTAIRARNAAEAVRLREQGLLFREIAERMGISPQYAAALVNDPDGAQDRERKERYRGTCAECGGATSGCNGRGDKRPTRCRRCMIGRPREAPEPPGRRVCATSTCAAILSRYNASDTCGPCQRTAAEEERAALMAELAAQPERMTREQRKEAILALLEQRGPLSTRELAAELDFSQGTIADDMRRMVADGEVATANRATPGRASRYLVAEDFDALMGAA